MDASRHRIETVRRFYVPGHTTYRDLRHYAQPHGSGRTKSMRKTDDPPPADESCSSGPPNALPTAGLVPWYETGCFFVPTGICPRCRGPPLRLISKKSDEGGCPMGQRNDNTNEVFTLQNRFTAYLLTALKRKKRDYIKKQTRLCDHELLTDFQSEEYNDSPVHLLKSTDQFSYRIEYDTLMQALSQLTDKERYILFERILNDCGYEELAHRLELNYGSVATAYHRIIKKLRKALWEGSK